MREHVVAASKAMKKGDWKQCKDYILAVKVTVGTMCTNILLRKQLVGKECVIILNMTDHS